MDRDLTRAVSGKDARPLTHLRSKRPLLNRRLLVVNHLYRDIFYLLDMFEGAGLNPKQAEIIGTVYPFDRRVKQQVRNRGYSLHHDHVYDTAAFEQTVHSAIDRLAKRAGNQPILIVDDGGTAAKIISRSYRQLKCRDGRPLFEIVEITRNGLRPIEAINNAGEANLPFGFSSGALSDLKRDVLSPAYAETSLKKAFSAIDQARLPYKPVIGKDGPTRVGVIGAGAMGAPAILRLADSNYLVTVYEKDPKQIQVLRTLRANSSVYFEIAGDKSEAIRGQHMIIGTTGEENLIGPKHIPMMRHNAIVFQISSKQKEFDMKRIGEMAEAKQQLHRSDGLAQQSYTYVFKNVSKPRGQSRRHAHLGDGAYENTAGEKKIHFIGDGWTVNHNGSLDGTAFHLVRQELDIIADQVFSVAAGKQPEPIGRLPYKCAQPGSVFRTNSVPLRDASGVILNELLPNQVRKQIDAYERRRADQNF